MTHAVGGLVNATCGNATELIIAIFALIQHKVDVLKCSLLGSVLSNLLLVLGSSLFCGGIVNISKQQNFDRVCIYMDLVLHQHLSFIYCFLNFIYIYIVHLITASNIYYDLGLTETSGCELTTAVPGTIVPCTAFDV